ncbi:aminoglycoside phosphotransferase family protein [Caldalkalibacillus mannanilyticus]|uniref:aminoglycoside phosphotransferase family protein n=1 Tax=Caldalkalibacillus mannanilyticus TaxID=1418 RepID=UPI00046AB95B|nr:aminoglycoside phosphotransferase family protein [Caldalkalibacillus mannanilyticus]
MEFIRKIKDLDLDVDSVEELKGSFASKIYRIRAQNKDKQPLSLIYKIFQEGRDQEVEIYQKLSQHLEKWMPPVHAMFLEEPRSILIEDMGASLKAEKHSEQVEYYNVQLVLKALADLHSSSRVKVEKWMTEGLITPYPYSAEWAVWTIEQMKRLNESDSMFQVDKWLMPLTEKIEQFYPQYPSAILAPLTVTHGDPHLDNLFVHQGQAIFIDWEWVHVASPVRDISILLQDFDEEAIRQNIIDEYYDLLMESGYPLKKEQYHHDLKWTLFDNTLMMLGWDIELYFMNQLEKKKLERKLQFKLKHLLDFTDI